MCGVSTPCVSDLTFEVVRRGSTVARLKLKGIDGDPHKQRSVWFNSKRREEPYQDLTCLCTSPRGLCPQGTQTQVLHGGRQLVPCGVGLSLATSPTPVVGWISPASLAL